MLFRIIDIIADRDLEAMASLAVIATLVMGAAFFGWLIMAK